MHCRGFWPNLFVQQPLQANVHFIGDHKRSFVSLFRINAVHYPFSSATTGQPAAVDTRICTGRGRKSERERAAHTLVTLSYIYYEYICWSIMCLHGEAQPQVNNFLLPLNCIWRDIHRLHWLRYAFIWTPYCVFTCTKQIFVRLHTLIKYKCTNISCM